MVTVSIQNNPSNLDTNGIDKSVHIMEQVKAMRSTISKKSRGGASTDDSEGAEPRPSDTGTGQWSHKQLEGDNKWPMGVKHLNWLSDRFAVGTPARGMPTHSTILVEQSQLIVEEVQKL